MSQEAALLVLDEASLLPATRGRFRGGRAASGSVSACTTRTSGTTRECSSARCTPMPGRSASTSAAARCGNPTSGSFRPRGEQRASSRTGWSRWETPPATGRSSSRGDSDGHPGGRSRGRRIHAALARGSASRDACSRTSGGASAGSAAASASRRCSIGGFPSSATASGAPPSRSAGHARRPRPRPPRVPLLASPAPPLARGQPPHRLALSKPAPGGAVAVSGGYNCRPRRDSRAAKGGGL